MKINCNKKLDIKLFCVYYVGMKKLKKYILSKGTITAYAEKIKVSRQHLQNVLGGRYPISIKLAQEIIKESKKKFTLNDFFKS